MKKGKTIRTSSKNNSQTYITKTSISSRKQQCRSVINSLLKSLHPVFGCWHQVKIFGKGNKDRSEGGWRKGNKNISQSYDRFHQWCNKTHKTGGHSQNLRSTQHLSTNTLHLWHIVLPVPSCLEGFWVALSFEADWLSAQPMSSLRLCTSLCTSTRWVQQNKSDVRKEKKNQIKKKITRMMRGQVVKRCREVKSCQDSGQIK